VHRLAAVYEERVTYAESRSHRSPAWASARHWPRRWEATASRLPRWGD